MGEALDQVGVHPGKLSTQGLVDVLYAILAKLAGEKRAPEIGAMFGYYVEQIFHEPRERGELSTTELGRLEWQLLTGFPVFRFSERAVTLHELLQADPDFFADVVKHAFLADGEEQKEQDADESTRNRARLAWDLLSTWHTPPGLQQDGTLNPQALREWFVLSRQACASNNQAKVGDRRIREAFANVPTQTASGHIEQSGILLKRPRAETLKRVCMPEDSTGGECGQRRRPMKDAQSANLRKAIEPQQGL